MEYQPIVHVWINHDNDLVDLTLTTKAPARKTYETSETLHTNKKHPFLTVEQGFVPVGQLKLGMHVVEANGLIGEVTGWKSVPGTQAMYNLEIAQDHTYTVGTGQWVVHNCDPSLLENPEAQRYAKSVVNAFSDHLTDSDLSGAWRDLHGDPVPKADGGYYNHIGEVNDALRSGKNAANGFKRLLESGVLSESDQCIVQCMLSRTSKTMDYVENIINRDQWTIGASIPSFP